MDLDATVVTAHSEKAQATPTWKKTFGFHPLAAFADHGPAGSGEPLAIMLRPGNAGSNTAADHIEVARLALAQLPAHLRRKVLIRADSGGGTHEFLAWLAKPAGGWPTPPGSPSPPRLPPPSARSPPRRGRPPMTAAARSGPARGSPRSPACWTWRPGRRGCG